MSHFLKIKRFEKNQFLKTVSIILLSAFSLQELAMANPDLSKIMVQGGAEAKDSKIWARKLLPSIPESVATIEDAYKSPDSNKTLILIQDAHTNNSGQLNVAKALDLIFQKEPIQYVFLEAGAGNESLSFLRKYASEEKRKEVAHSFLINGKLQGTEYLDLTSNHNFVLWGVEDLSLYAKSVATYRAVAKEREKFQRYLSQIDTTIKTLKPKIYNPFLVNFDEKYQKYQKEETPLTTYYEILTTEAKKLDISFSNYPHLETLNKLKEMESKIDFKKASEEEQLAVSSLSSEDQKDLLSASKEDQSLLKLSANENQVQKAFFALLEEKIATRLNQYPELSKYFLYIKEVRKIQAKAILEEQKALEKEVFTALSRTEDEANLIKASRNLESLKKLFNLTLTPDEFDAYQKDKQSFDIAHLTGFLNKKIMDLKDHYDRAVFLESGYEDIIQKCEEFYSLTYQRDRKFIENLTQKMNAENQEKAILITGGYHTPNLKYLLKDQGVSYINLTPQVLQETNQKRYEALLLNQRIDLIQSVNTTPKGFTSAVHTNMLMRILGLGKLGIPYDEALAQGLANSTENEKLIVLEMKEREKNLGNPLAETERFGSGKPIIPFQYATVGARLAESENRNPATKTFLRSALEKGHVIANHILVSFHAAFLSSLFSLSPTQLYSSTDILKFIFASHDTIISALFWYLTFHIGVWWHERAHYWGAVKTLTLRDDLLKEAQENTRGLRRVAWEIRMFFLAPYGKFPGIQRLGLKYGVEAPYNLLQSASGPRASGYLAYTMLPIAIIMISTFRFFHFSEPLIYLGRLALGIGAVALLDRLFADPGKYKEWRDGEKKAKESSKRVEALTQGQGAWLDQAPAIKQKMKTTRSQIVVRPDGVVVKAPWGFRNSGMGGRHTEAEYPESNISLQESMYIPLSPISVEDAQEMTVALQNRFRTLLSGEGNRVMGIGLEGGLSPYVTPHEGDPVPDLTLWRLMKQSIQDLGYVPGRDAPLALDGAASELEIAYRDKDENHGQDGKSEAVGEYLFWRDKGQYMSRDNLMDLYRRALREGIPFISFEDIFSENDKEGWRLFKAEFGDKVWVIGDDLVTTNDKPVEDAIDDGLMNALLVKANQIGTLTETVSAMLVAMGLDVELVISHRSKKPNDDMEAHLALATNAMGLKSGGGSNTERLVVYNAVAKLLREAAERRVKSPEETQQDDDFFKKAVVTKITAIEESTNAGIPTVGVTITVQIPGSNIRREFTGAAPLGTSAGTGEAIHLVDSIVEKNAITERHPEFFDQQKDGTYRFKKNITNKDISIKREEDLQLLWKEANRYKGKGTKNAARNVEDILSPLFIGKRISEIGEMREFDRSMLQLELQTAQARGKSVENPIDVMQRKANLGMNAILPMSLALSRFKAASEGKELYDIIREEVERTMRSIIAEHTGKMPLSNLALDDLKVEFQKVAKDYKAQGQKIYPIIRRHLGIYDGEDSSSTDAGARLAVRSSYAQYEHLDHQGFRISYDRSVFVDNKIAQAMIDDLLARDYLRHGDNVSLVISTNSLAGMGMREEKTMYGGSIATIHAVKPSGEDFVVIKYVLKQPHSADEFDKSVRASIQNPVLGPHVIYTRKGEMIYGEENRKGEWPKPDLIVEEAFPSNRVLSRLNLSDLRLDAAKNLAMKIHSMIDPVRGSNRVVYPFSSLDRHIFFLDAPNSTTDVRFIDWGNPRSVSIETEEGLAQMFGLLKESLQKFGDRFWNDFGSEIIQLSKGDESFHQKVTKALAGATKATVTGARLTIQTSDSALKPITPSDAVTFIVRVHSETNQIGKLVLGSLLLDYKENADGSLTIQGLDEKERTVNPSEWTKINLEGGQSALQITFSMSDFKQALDMANQTVEEAPIGKALNNIKAVGVFDLEGLNPNVKGFDEVVIPLLIEELKLAHKRPWGQNAKFLLKGSEELIQRISSQIPQGQDFIVTKEEDLGKEYASASHILITTPGKSEKGLRHFFIQSIQEGDIPNFRGALRGALSLARVDKLETTNKDFSEIMSFVGRLLGHEIASPSEYIQVTENPTLIAIEKIRNLYSLPAIMRLPLNQIVQGARLAIRMIQQAA